jgi:acyl-CoA dehydrogenase
VLADAAVGGESLSPIPGQCGGSVYKWSETELAIQQAVRQFVDAEIRPIREDLEFGDLPPYDVVRKLWKTFGLDVMAADFVDKQLAKERARHDGAAAASGSVKEDPRDGFVSMATGFVLNAELARVSPGIVTAICASIGLSANTIMSRGSLEQKRRWLKPLLSFEKVGAWGLTEPGSGSDAFSAMKSVVRPDWEGLRLNGQKTFITNAPYADTIVVFAKFDDGVTPARERKIVAFVLDSGMRGLTQGRPLRKMGCHSSPTGELWFDDVYLEPDRQVGDARDASRGDEKSGAKAVFVAERYGVAAVGLGIIEECIEQCIRYAKGRVQFGQPIADYQLIQLKLARMEIARSNVANSLFRAVEMTVAGDQPTLAEASAAKVYASETALEVALDAVQLFGGNGYMSEYPVEQLARDAKALAIYSGTTKFRPRRSRMTCWVGERTHRSWVRFRSARRSANRSIFLGTISKNA